MRDLFGEIAISLRELQLWLYKVPRMPHHSTRRANYLRQWNVESKLARAKEAGELAAIFGDESCEFCGQLLCQEQEAFFAPISPIDELSRLRRRVAVLELLLQPGKENAGLVSRRALGSEKPTSSA